MAWQAKVVGQQADVYSGTVTILVEYVDSAQPNTALATGSFQLPLDFVTADAVREVRVLGQVLRAAYTKAASLTNYVGQVISIP